MVIDPYGPFMSRVVRNIYVSITISDFFKKKDHFFGQKISKILCLAFDFICIYYMSSDY